MSNTAPPRHTGSLIFGSIHEETSNKELSQQNKSKDSASQSDKNDAVLEGKDKLEGKTKSHIKNLQTNSSWKTQDRIAQSEDQRENTVYDGSCTRRKIYRTLANRKSPVLLDCGQVETQRPYHVAARTEGFFTVIFLCLEDKFRIMDEGPYFFNSAGLYLRNWVARFNSDKEDLTWAPVWIKMYSLPEEYWDEGLLKDIGNGLGEYIKVAE